jgi:osmotically-inducible protein OsmY
MKHALKLSLTLALATSLSGCAIATAGIKKGDERSFVGSMQDVNAGRVIAARMTRAHDFELGGVDVEVAESVVLLSGNVPTQQDKIEAARIAWSAPRIEEVGNEILIKGKQSFIRNTKDGFLEKSVRTRLTADKLVKARNFNVETHDGIVYLMGVARTKTELKRAAEIAATTRGARQVVSYARIADLPAARRAELQAEADYILKPNRDLPDFLTAEPQPGVSPAAPSQTYTLPDTVVQAQPAVPIQELPLSAPLPFNPPSASVTAPSEIDMGDRLGKELPTDEQLGAYRSGQAGEAVSIIESAPYYLDPDTGEEIQIRYDANGNMLPRIIR